MLCRLGVNKCIVEAAVVYFLLFFYYLELEVSVDTNLHFTMKGLVPHIYKIEMPLMCRRINMLTKSLFVCF